MANLAKTYIYLAFLVVVALATDQAVKVSTQSIQKAAPANMATDGGQKDGCKTHYVKVGGTKASAAGMPPAPMLQYSPESIKAEIGDTVVFQFYQANHTATQSTFDKPCVKMEGGKDSGFMPNQDGKPGVEWKMQVETMEPIWMYCKQKTGTHCGKGMVFSINAKESGDKTFTAFKQQAMKQNATDSNAAPPAAQQNQLVVDGQGKAADGSTCDCKCLCDSGSFPVPGDQAVNNFGGFAGMISS